MRVLLLQHIASELHELTHGNPSAAGLQVCATHGSSTKCRPAWRGRRTHSVKWKRHDLIHLQPSIPAIEHSWHNQMQHDDPD